MLRVVAQALDSVVDFLKLAPQPIVLGTARLVAGEPFLSAPDLGPVTKPGSWVLVRRSVRAGCQCLNTHVNADVLGAGTFLAALHAHGDAGEPAAAASRLTVTSRMLPCQHSGSHMRTLPIPGRSLRQPLHVTVSDPWSARKAVFRWQPLYLWD